MDIRTVLHSIIDPFFDFVYPPVCISCKTPLSDGSHRVCSGCWDSITRLSSIHPLYLQTREKLLASGHVHDLVSAFVFEKEGAFQHIAHALKYNGYESLGRELGARLGKTMIEWGITGDVLIPVPLHKAKRRERGYNQAEQIARGVGSITGLKIVASAVSRVKHTQTQTQLNSDERKRNMEAAFTLKATRSKEVHGLTCLLVDDVITTGATINSCAEVLLNAGAKRIVAASVALAQ